MIDESKIAEFMGETKARLDAQNTALIDERATRVARSNSDAQELNRRLEEHQRGQDSDFRNQGERIGKLESDLQEHMLTCKGHSGEASWKDKKVVAGVGGGAGLMALIEMLRHWLME